MGRYWVHLLFVIGIRQSGSALTETNYGGHIPIKDNDRVLVYRRRHGDVPMLLCTIILIGGGVALILWPNIVRRSGVS